MEFEDNRFITRTKAQTDVEVENTLRPTSFNEYVGQEKLKDSLNTEKLEYRNIKFEIQIVTLLEKTNYLTSTGSYYNGTTAKDVNTRYASDANWSNRVFEIMKSLYEKL